MSYAEALAYLQSFTDNEQVVAARDPSRFQLGRVVALLELLGHPETRYRSVHVVGTKGKGSTAAMIAGALQAAGARAGLYTSPHLHSFRERIRVDGRLIEGRNLAAMVDLARPMVDRVHTEQPALGRLTTFEIATALALAYFAGQGVEYAVLEAGLGGRLDATNVVRPLVTVLTPIGLDHTQYLGDTVQAIAAEKAAVIKPGAVVVSASQRPEARAVIEARAAETGAQLYLVGRDYFWQATAPQTIAVRGPVRLYDDVHVPLLGEHQLENAALAIGALDLLRDQASAVTEEAVRQGIAAVQWPGRLEVLVGNPLLIVDGAHNSEAMRRLCAALGGIYGRRRRTFVLGCSADKDLAGIVAELAPFADRVVITQSRHPRSAPVAELAALARSHSLAVDIAPDVPAALECARGLAGPGDLICATGSLFVVAEAREAVLGIRTE